ncbi:response regulator [uncultured Sphingomonas sp.]|uniref:response regulator n=1 Tax=uncultured Sphingomonas sp. TaxID=158754 RepID=UPI0035CA4BC9
MADTFPTQAAPFGIVIADDHELARSGLRAMVEGEPDLRVVGEARDGLEAVDLCRLLAPGLVLLDVRMPRLDGLGAARRISDECPGVRIVMVTMHDSPAYLAEALQAGAAGYVLKDASRRELLAALRSVLDGDTFLNGAMAARIIGRIGPPAAPGSKSLDRSPIEPLTPRELDVLGLVARGMTNKEVGRELEISPGTVKVHVERIIGKLGVADRTQAAVRGVERGLVRMAE